jgi:hypothetical protein
LGEIDDFITICAQKCKKTINISAAKKTPFTIHHPPSTIHQITTTLPTPQWPKRKIQRSMGIIFLAVGKIRRFPTKGKSKTRLREKEKECSLAVARKTSNSKARGKGNRRKRPWQRSCFEMSREGKI